MTVNASLEELHSAFDDACGRLEEGRAYRSWFKEIPGHDGSAHVEREGPYYCYVVTERGTENERRRTTDREEILYWLLKDVTSDIALKYELENRRPEEDFRRLYFGKQEELLRSLHPRWGELYRSERENILRSHPFRDGAG